MSNPFETDLSPSAANYCALTPTAFLRRSATVYPNKVAVIHGERRYTYAEFESRCLRLARALQRAGVTSGDTVAVMAPNIPEMLEAHNAVPLLGAVLNAINIRLDAATIRFILEHGEAKQWLGVPPGQQMTIARRGLDAGGGEDGGKEIHQ